MMGILAGLLGAFSGPLTRYLVLSVGAVMAITGAHLLIENWKGNLRAEGERRCDARWEQTIREEERNAAAADARSARALLESERKTTGELHDQITSMEDELERLRAGASGGDERCLSDGVLKRLWQPGPAERKPGARQAPPTPGPASLLQKLFPGAYVEP